MKQKPGAAGPVFVAMSFYGLEQCVRAEIYPTPGRANPSPFFPFFGILIATLDNAVLKDYLHFGQPT